MKQTNFKGKQKGGDKRGEFGDGGGGEGEKEDKQAVEGHPGAAGLHCRVQFTW